MSAPTETPKAADAATLVLRALDMERALTEEDYATKSDALQACCRAWEDVRRGAAP